MKSKTKVDIILVGLGLAGAALAWRLIKAGKSILVIDNENSSSASKVAAGLINPVTGKRLVKEKKADKYLVETQLFYGEVGRFFDEKFHFESPMHRLFDSEDIKLAWKKRHIDFDYEAYIGDDFEPSLDVSPYSGFVQLQTGYLDTTKYLEAIKGYLIENDSYRVAQINYSDIELDGGISWKNIHADKVVFCEGARVKENPWFGYLPMQPSLGEILTLNTTNQLPDYIINAGNWILPITSQTFKLGATYRWPEKGRPYQEVTSEQGKEQLLDSLKRIMPGMTDVTLVNHVAGIRPNTVDKRPVIGFHPEHHYMAVFNGFGSKGSMMIPYYSKHFIDVLLYEADIEPDIDIDRFETLYEVTN